MGCARVDDGLAEEAPSSILLSSVGPEVILPGTRITVDGSGFLEADVGQHLLRVTVGRDDERRQVEIAAKLLDGQLKSRANRLDH